MNTKHHILLNGSWDVGQTGSAVFGALCAIAALGFIIAELFLMAGWSR